MFGPMILEWMSREDKVSEAIKTKAYGHSIGACLNNSNIFAPMILGWMRLNPFEVEFI